MAKTCELYIDENGVPDLTHRDNNFTLCGIIVGEHQGEKLKVVADQVKFKYWGETSIVLHSRDIGRKTGDFAVLNNPIIEKDFHKDLFGLLSTGAFRCVIISIDKKKASSAGWDAKKIRDEAFDSLLEIYLRYLARKSFKGRILLESSGAKDIEFYKRYSYYLSHGLPSLGLTHQGVKQILTSLSFVTKNNEDIETQLADLLAYPATCKFLHDEGIKPIIPGSYEDKMVNILMAKVVDMGGTHALVRIPV